MDQILDTILTDTFTLSQLKLRLRILKSNLLKTFFAGSQELEQTSLEELNWLKSLPVSFYQQFNKDNIYKIFSELEEADKKLAVVTIYLTFEPDDEATKAIGTAARKTFGKTLLLDIKYDPKLIAGCALVWKGVYKDYSLRAKIEERKEQILQHFKKFLR